MNSRSDITPTIVRPDADDLSLVALAINGRTAAFTVLVQRHQGALRAFLRRLTNNDALADDLAQETFIKAHNSLGAFEGRAAFRSWLLGIGYREFLAHRRKSVRRRNLMDEQGGELEPQPSAPPSGLKPDLEWAMAQLTAEQRAAMMLCFVHGLSHSEAAETLDVPLGTLKSHINRGRAALRDLLGAYA